jgi:hypothetical protein
MAVWWESISMIEQIFFIIAAPATLILIIQTLMLIFGGGFEGPDAGFDSDVSGAWESADASDIQASDTSGLRLFSMNGILTFLTVFGWSGVFLLGMDVNVVFAGAISAVLGFGALVGMAFMIRSLMKLSESGNLNYRKALGKSARVYLTIPPVGKGQGKISMMLGETLGEFPAVTEGSEPIPTGTVVRIVDLAGNVFTVE